MGQFSITVNMADRPYKLKIERDTEERVRKAVNLINKKIKEYSDSYSFKDKQDLLAMLVLQHTNDLIALKEEKEFMNTDLQNKLVELNELLEESNRLQKLMLDGRPSEAMTKQVVGFMRQVDEKIAEVQYMERFRAKSKKDSEVLEIGYTEEVVYTPDYTKKELLDAMVFEYSLGDNNEKDPDGEKG